MSAKFIQNIYSSIAHSAYLRHKIGLASWEIRPWISLMQQRMVDENVFLQRKI